MSKATPVMGQTVMIWIGGKVVALSTNCSINRTTNMVDISSKDDGDFDNSIPGTLGATITNDFLCVSEDTTRTTDLTQKQLRQAWKNKTKLAITVGPTTNYAAAGIGTDPTAWEAPTGADSVGETGYAYITAMTETYQKGQAATGQLTLQVVGSLDELGE